jgi:lysophospholipase
LSQERFSAPPGWAWGAFRRGAPRLRYGWVEPPAPSARLVLVAGFSEFGEKYFETIRDLLARNLAIYELDWRGQGGSERYFAGSQRPYAVGYDEDVADLAAFIDAIVPRTPALPLLVLGHSMGGNLALRYLHDHPGHIAAAMLVAPMLGLKTGATPTWLARALAVAGTSCGLGARYLPGRGDWVRDPLHLGKGASGDPVRDGLHHAWFATRPDLALGGPTFKWLAEAFRSVALLRNRDYLRAVRTPILLASAGCETFVDPRSHHRAARLLPNCRLVEFPDSRHEILLERDVIRDRLLAAFDTFLAEVLDPARSGGEDTPSRAAAAAVPGGVR